MYFASSSLNLQVEMWNINHCNTKSTTGGSKTHLEQTSHSQKNRNLTASKMRMQNSHMTGKVQIQSHLPFMQSNLKECSTAVGMSQEVAFVSALHLGWWQPPQAPEETPSVYASQGDRKRGRKNSSVLNGTEKEKASLRIHNHSFNPTAELEKTRVSTSSTIRYTRISSQAKS